MFIKDSYFSQNVAPYLRYFKNKYFLKHLLVTASGNISKYSALHQYDTIYWYIMVYHSKILFSGLALFKI